MLTTRPKSFVAALLQRSRTRWSAERSQASLRVESLPLLQRSRTRWSAESWLEIEWTVSGQVASTEPHSLECGEGG